MHAYVQAITSIGQLDFVLELAGSAGGRQGILHFNTDLFDKATAHRMLGHYGVRISSLLPWKPLCIMGPQHSLCRDQSALLAASFLLGLVPSDLSCQMRQLQLPVLHACAPSG